MSNICLYSLSKYLISCLLYFDNFRKFDKFINIVQFIIFYIFCNTFYKLEIGRFFAFTLKDTFLFYTSSWKKKWLFILLNFSLIFVTSFGTYYNLQITQCIMNINPYDSFILIHMIYLLLISKIIMLKGNNADNYIMIYDNIVI